MIEYYDSFIEFFKKLNPYILGGAVGALIHRMRNQMSWSAFFKSAVMSMFISFCMGTFCKEYLLVKNENIIFVACGLSGAFSKLILDEIEKILKLTSVYVKIKLGITKKTDE